MEAKDLMIDNYVLCGSSKITKQIKEILKDSIYVDDYCYKFEELEPIPIEDEDFWGRNGFIYQDDDSYTLFDDYYSINAKEVYDGLWQIVIEHCELINDTEICCVSYVHQLQQFLNLCGIDIEIKL